MDGRDPPTDELALAFARKALNLNAKDLLAENQWYIFE